VSKPVPIGRARQSELGIPAGNRRFVLDVRDGEEPATPLDANKEPHMKALAPTLFLALALGAGTTLTACEGLREKPGVDGTAYSLGHLDVMVHADPKKVVEAAESVLKEMDIQIVSSVATGIDGKVVARSALEKRIDIVVERQDAETTKYSIQVGSFGDEKISREIHEKMKAKLG
jgi:hypothetical protein